MGQWILFMVGYYHKSGSCMEKIKPNSQLFILMIGWYFCLVKLYHANAIAVIPTRFTISS